MSTATRGSTCCCTLVENSQLYGRTPQPFRMPPLCAALAVGLPKFVSDTFPHSPFACTLVRSQSGITLWFASVHDRVTVLARRFTGAIESPYCPCTPSAFTYLFRLARTAVLPLPNTSYTPPNRGTMSLKSVSGVSGRSRFRFGTNGAGPRCSAGAMMSRYSNRRPTLSVSLLTVHLSCAYTLTSDGCVSDFKYGVVRSVMSVGLGTVGLVMGLLNV